MNEIEYKYMRRMLNDAVYLTRGNDYSSLPAIFANVPEGYSMSRSLTLEENMRKFKILREISSDLYLNQKTIMPRESISVLISCRTNEIPRRITGDIKIKVSIDGEEHVFTFNRR
ncbi:MAG: hypothetical protein JW927_00015 [Deltaproteobacteria bacterium]|nr:hypothetical protein [Deltaproteobacteria bacterium]